MKPRFFTLSQIHQRIDERLRTELRKRLPDPTEVCRLQAMKLRAKRALHRLLASPSPA